MTRTSTALPASDRDTGGAPADGGVRGLAVYVLIGTLFGIVLVKTEVISWFRIQEMFRFQSFHMYGLMMTAVGTGVLSLQVIKRLGLTTLSGEPITLPAKEWGTGTRYWAGGTLFGVGWALTGACPGPLAALLGAGVGVIALPIVAAIAGAWVYGLLRPRLPH